MKYRLDILKQHKLGNGTDGRCQGFP
jgi:hypothetical protein